MMKRSLAALALIALLPCCGDDTPTEAIGSLSPNCPASLAQSVANRYFDEQVSQIQNAETREEGCDRYARSLAGMTFWLMVFDQNQEQNCSWDMLNEQADPEMIVTRRLRSFKPEATRLCGSDLDDRIARLATQERGRRILESMSPAEREEMQRAYEGR